MKVPSWLVHLRTDVRGLVVPYINTWGPEVEDAMTIRYDRIVGAVATFKVDDYDQPPDFTRQSPQRQRECMLRMLCQVCGQPTDWTDAHLPISSMSTERVNVDGKGAQYVTTEPWLCGRCARFAARVCPDLIQRGRGGDLEMVPVRHPEQVTLVKSTGWIEGKYEAATKANPVVMWVKVWLRDPRLVIVQAEATARR